VGVVMFDGYAGPGWVKFARVAQEISVKKMLGQVFAAT